MRKLAKLTGNHVATPLMAAAIASTGFGMAACERADAEPTPVVEPPPATLSEPSATPGSRAPATPATGRPAGDRGLVADRSQAAPPALAAVRSEPVQDLTGPGGEPFEVAVRNRDQVGHDRLIGRSSFEISLRTGATAHYPCSSCHQPGQAPGPYGHGSTSHRNVQPRHPERSGSSCTTCHATDDVEQLVLIGGEQVPLAHAYRLCAQCHYPQVDDWAAGIHGKRLDGWRGRRVLMGCSDCHDPHLPAIAPREPFPGPQLPRARRVSP